MFGRLLIVLFALIVLGGLGGIAYLAIWETAPETKTIEVIIPDERFSR